MNSKEVFSDKAIVYSNSRPSYSQRLIEYLYQTIGISNQSVIADIGAGTGIFAKLLLDRGSSVICVEPNEAMRAIAEKDLSVYGNVGFSDGDAENTKIESESVDFITVAQAFHWFETDKFKSESKRILKCDGKAILVWNTRDTECELCVDNYRIFKRYCPRFKGFSGGVQDHDERIIRYFGGKYERVDFDNPIAFNRETFISRCLSGSYSLQKDDERYNDYITELNELFEKYSENGCLIMPNKSIAYIGRV